MKLRDEALALDPKEVCRHLWREELCPFLEVNVVLAPDVVGECDLVELGISKGVKYNVIHVEIPRCSISRGSTESTI
jgi:hypothetical protein